MEAKEKKMNRLSSCFIPLLAVALCASSTTRSLPSAEALLHTKTPLSPSSFVGHWSSYQRCVSSPIPPSLGGGRGDSFSISSRRSQTALNLGDWFNWNKSSDTAKSTDEVEGSKAQEEEYQDGAYDADDPVEKIFSFFFGKREEAPMGMSRFGPDRFPEQYPATKTEWAEPVVSDDKEMTMIRLFLKNTNLEKRPLRLTYDANRNGWSADAFHRAVDKKGGGVVLCTTNSGLKCGGYNPKGWVGYGEARGSIAAFLFQIGGQYAAPNAPGIKLQKVGGKALAQVDNPESGPSFGADALVIPLAKSSPRVARSKLGSYYERLPDGTKSLFGKDSSVQLKELKVYHGVYEEGEYIPFTDAEPFALY